MEAAWKSASFFSDGSSRISDLRWRMIDSSCVPLGRAEEALERLGRGEVQRVDLEHLAVEARSALSMLPRSVSWTRALIM